MAKANTVVILDFETTGLSPDNGDRAIEIGAVRMVNGQVTEHFQQLMNPGIRINHFIADYTGITNEMVQDAPPCAEVMADFADFIGDDNLVAHNASFDKRFLDAELSRISRDYGGKFGCSLLASRRIFQDAPNHRLGTLVDYADIASDGTFHRALYDSQMTAQLWLALLNNIQARFELASIPFELMLKLAKTPKKSVAKMLEHWR